MGLMARSTPAWREPYVAVLDQLIERHTGWWSANDWLTQFGAEAGMFLNIQEHPRSSPRRGRGRSQAEGSLGRRAPSIWRFAPLQPREGITHHTGSPRVFSHARLRPLGIYPHESLKRPFRSFVPPGTRAYVDTASPGDWGATGNSTPGGKRHVHIDPRHAIYPSHLHHDPGIVALVAQAEPAAAGITFTPPPIFTAAPASNGAGTLATPNLSGPPNGLSLTAKGFVYTGKKIEYTPVAADVGKLITITFAARIPLRDHNESHDRGSSCLRNW